MTRRDYSLITEVLKTSYQECLVDDRRDSREVVSIAHDIATALEKDNKAFDKVKFITDIRGRE